MKGKGEGGRGKGEGRTGSGQTVIPIEPKRTRFTDGRWGMAYHAPNLKIPARAPDGLPPRRQLDERFRRAISVRYTPHGEQDQLLDLIVYMAPDENPREGQFGWVPWRAYGSKEAFIAHQEEQKRLREECRRYIEAMKAKENRTDS